ncbi:DUF6074 family protein [Nitratireductor rhodophyticola]|uniref:DUF6074 family protein n=1 Tax=Nitratireductor rhodophyticola TaxID=2854036 RepID=UPI00300A1506
MAGHDHAPSQHNRDCLLIAFPLHRRTGKIRDVARKLLAKSTDRHADCYRRQVTDALDRNLLRLGVENAQISKQIGSFWRAVDLEISRISYRKQGPGGIA